MTLARDYKAHQASEKILAKDPKYGYVGCRFSADFGATGIATNGESATRDDGRMIGKPGRFSMLNSAWRAAGKGRRGYNQGHVDEIHKAMFPSLPQPIKAVTEEFSDDVDGHIGTNPSKGDFAISIALRLSVLPSTSPLRRYAGTADHQVVIHQKRWTKARGVEYKILDGMIPYSENNAGYWAPRAHIGKAAKAIAEGLVIFELYPVAGWTAERMAVKQKNAQIAALKEGSTDVVNLKKRLTACTAEKAAMFDQSTAAIAVLQGELDQALDSIASCRADVLDEAIQALDEIK